MTINIENLIKVLDMNKTQFADYCDIPRSTISDIISGRMKNLPHHAIVKLIKEKNINAAWFFTGEGDIIRPFETQKSDVVKNMAVMGRMNRRPKFKKLVDLLTAIEEEHYDQIENILKTFTKL